MSSPWVGAGRVPGRDRGNRGRSRVRLRVRAADWPRKVARLPLDSVSCGWDRRRVPALTLPSVPVDRVAALRALPAVVVAVAGGAWLALVVVAASGADLTVGVGAWVCVAGACACVSGWVVGTTGNATPAALLGVAAVAAAILAVGAAEGDAAVARPDKVERHLMPFNPGPRAETPRKARGAAPAPTDRTAPAVPDQTAPAAPLTLSAADTLVRSYYAALDAGEFEQAWARLSPGVQAAFGGFETWRHGYDTTLEHQVDGVQLQSGGVIQVTLTATDRTPCGGTTTQRFAVTWRVEGRQAAALSAVRLAGQDPAAAC